METAGPFSAVSLKQLTAPEQRQGTLPCSVPVQEGQVELAESETGTGTETGAETGTGMDNQMGGVAALGRPEPLSSS